MIHKIDWLSSVNKEISKLEYKFTVSSSKYELKLNNNKVFFNKSNNNFTISPNEWLEAQHKNHGIHECGLVAWLVTLAKYCKNHKVRFYDIGALFGYHSFIAKSLFKNIYITSVEANPISAEYIFNNIKENEKDKIKIVNAFVSNESGNFTYLIDIFNFTKKGSKKYYEKIISIKVKDQIKKFINFFSKKYLLSKHLISNINSISLRSLLKEKEENEINIIKIDTEGYQANFLPPAINILSEKNFIILLELDNKETMKKFGTSNNELLQSFLDKNYKAYWMDHRKCSKIEKIHTILEKHDRNSLLVLIPSKFVC